MYTKTNTTVRCKLYLSKTDEGKKEFYIQQISSLKMKVK